MLRLLGEGPAGRPGMTDTDDGETKEDSFICSGKEFPNMVKLIWVLSLPFLGGMKRMRKKE